MKYIFILMAETFVVLAFSCGCTVRNDIVAPTPTAADSQYSTAPSPTLSNDIEKTLKSPEMSESTVSEENVSPEFLILRAFEGLGDDLELNSAGMSISGQQKETKIGNYSYDVDLNRDKQIDRLQIDVSVMDVDPDEIDYYNRPVHILLRVGEDEISWDNEWNDGIVIEPIDFNVNDEYTEIFYYSSGTDGGGNVTLIRYDGTKLYRYSKCSAMFGYILHDANGTIYYVDSYDDENGHYVAIMEFDLLEQKSSVYLKFRYSF
jgi:hypothetical protein